MSLILLLTSLILILVLVCLARCLAALKQVSSVSSWVARIVSFIQLVSIDKCIDLGQRKGRGNTPTHIGQIGQRHRVVKRVVKSQIFKYVKNSFDF